MRKVFIRIGSWILLKLFSLRYRIEIKGLHLLQKGGGRLFLPNHPAEIEPLMIFNLLARRFQPRPLVIEHFYYLKGARSFMDLVRAIPIPNFDLSANSWKVKQVDRCLEQVRSALQQGENFLIYPSGQLKREGHENIGGNSFIPRILETCPEAKVVLVRTSGLWGSLFSCAITGDSPDFWAVLGKGIRTILKSGVFFTPRRKVTSEFEESPADFPYKGTRLEINQYLEDWYNRYLTDEGKVVTSEPLRFVSLSLFSKVFPKVTRVERPAIERKKLEVPKEARDAVYKELKRLSGMGEISEEMDLSRDLGLDSLDVASVHTFLDQKFDVEAKVPAALKTVHDILYLVSEEEGQPKKEEGDGKRYVWPKEERPGLAFPSGKTLPECFLETAFRMGKTVACGDDTAGILTYRALLLRVLLLARKFRQFPEKHVGVLLPSTVACNLIVLALYFAGKTPVMLNWTAGERSLSFAHDLMEIKTVLSSRRFLERASVLELGKVEDSLLLMEDFRQTISLRDKLAALFLSWRGKRGISKVCQLDAIQEKDPAVILFTSGTENYPKAVPLSHRNILTNQRAASEVIEVKKEDILYGVLPQFHSFGFSVSGLFPLFFGLRVFYAPDPTDSHGMARDTFYRSLTMLCCAPSFYRNLFRVASPRQLKSVRLFVAGAEKAGPELFEHVKRLGGKKALLEGYGITECSPIVTIGKEGKPSKGVGYPLSNVELCVIHPETEEKLPDHEQGEICIRGPNVFEGYLGKEAPNPFIEIEGKQWYRSGDLGHIDADGALILGGRLKRFVKVGGEMVSLVAIEQVLTDYARDKGLMSGEEETPQFAVGTKEGEKPTLVLLTTVNLDKEKANDVLKEKGFPRIVKLSAVYQIDEIPMTGTGKMQLRRIREIIEEKDA